MKIILKDNVRKVGNKYDIVNVSDGYALNFLIPQGLAEKASPSALERITKTKEKVMLTREAQEEELNSQIAHLPDTISIQSKANEQGHLFAKIGPKEIHHTLTTLHSVSIPESSIFLKDIIKEVGEYNITLSSKTKKRSIKLIVSHS